MKNLLFLIVSFVFATNLFAQDSKQENVQDTVVVVAEKNQPIPQVSSIATKLFVPLKEIPLSVGVVNHSLIVNQNSLVLGDALKNISGVNTQTGNGVHDYFMIRGLNSLENSLILTDGTLEPEVTYYNLYNVERVEILKGPGAFLYGSNPLSGTVNLVRKQPQFGKFANVQSSYGDYNSFRNSIDTGFGKSESGFATRINILSETADNYRDDKENEVLAINPSFTFFANEDLIFNLNIEFINSKYEPDSGIPLLYDYTTGQLNRLADVDRKTSYQAPFDFSDQEITRVKFYTDYKINDHVSYSNKTYYSRLDWKSKGTLINGAFPNQLGGMDVKRTLSELDDVRDLFGMQNEFAMTYRAGTVSHHVLAGIEWSTLKEEYAYDISFGMPDIDLLNPVETADESQLMMFPYLKGDVTNTVIAPYVMDQITFSDKLKLLIGMRYDVIEFKNEAVGYAADRTYNHLSPLAGFGYASSEQVTFYANMGSAYAPPSSQVVGDQEAERSRQFEIGVKQRYLAGKINLDFSLYRIEKDGISIPSLDGISKQQGDMLSKGFETELRMEPLEDLFAFVSYAYSDVELTEFNERVPVGLDEYGRPIYMVFDRSGNKPAFTPEHILNIWTTKQWNNGLGLGGGLRYLSGQVIHVDNVFEMDAALILDATAFYTWNQFKFTINIKNLADETYEMRGFGASSVIPASPRSIFGKVSFSL